MSAIAIQEQLDSTRKTVGFDTYDITIRQLYDMVNEGIIDIAPEYQRHFVWQADRQSALIESIFLGIPVPSLFMATNKDSTWEVIDGLQRLMTIINFVHAAGDKLVHVKEQVQKLRLQNLDKLNSMNGSFFEDLPRSIQIKFLTRPIKLTVLNDRSDFDVRYDLFERLNTGGITLHPQEIRNCVYLGRFKDFIIECSTYKNYLSSVNISQSSQKAGTLEELVLKFFAYYENRSEFVHSVKEFLNDYMEAKTKKFNNQEALKTLFQSTFDIINECLADGIVRGNRKQTPQVLFEAVTIGVADCVTNNIEVDCSKLQNLLNDQELKKLTTGATNSRKRLNARIDYVKKYLK